MSINIPANAPPTAVLHVHAPPQASTLPATTLSLPTASHPPLSLPAPFETFILRLKVSTSQELNQVRIFALFGTVILL